jgi:hypothetical protein
LAYQGLEEENLDQKSPGPPGWRVDAAGQPAAHRKKRELLKSQLEIIWMDITYNDTSYVRGLYD